MKLPRTQKQATKRLEVENAALEQRFKRLEEMVWATQGQASRLVAHAEQAAIPTAGGVGSLEAFKQATEIFVETSVDRQLPQKSFEEIEQNLRTQVATVLEEALTAKQQALTNAQRLQQEKFTAVTHGN